MRHWIPVLFIVVSGCPATLAQGDAAPAQPEKPPALAGPRVEDKPRTGLVERESDGTIRRPEAPAEVAAVRLLELPKEVADSIEEVIRKRGRFLESFVEKNIELLGKLDTAGNTNDKLDQAILGLEALSKLAPLTKNGSLKKQIRALLPDDQAERFDAILNEYWDAIVAQERAKEAKKTRFEILASERFESMGREIAAAYERLEKSGAVLFAYFFDGIELSGEQESAIRTVLDEFVEETEGAATPRQEADIFFKVMSKLDIKQQTAVVRRFHEQQGTPKPTAKNKKKAPDKAEADAPMR